MLAMNMLVGVMNDTWEDVKTNLRSYLLREKIKVLINFGYFCRCRNRKKQQQRLVAREKLIIIEAL